MADFDLSEAGFDDRELDQMLMDMSAGDKDPDDVPEAPPVPLAKDGEIWLLGRHRLMCGDSTSPADARRLLNGQELDMIWTDPPYNVDYRGKAGKIKNDKMSAQEFEDFLLSAFKVMHDCLRPGGAIYVAHSEAGDGMVFRRAFMATGFKLAACLIWRKQTAVLGRGDITSSTSLFFTAGSAGPPTAGMATINSAPSWKWKCRSCRRWQMAPGSFAWAKNFIASRGKLFASKNLQPPSSMCPSRQSPICILP